MITISGGGAFTRKNIDDINSNFASVSAPFTPGRVIWLSPGSPNLSQPPDGSQARPYTDLASAYGAGRTAKNDIIVLVGDGTTGATARNNSAFTWAKDALHLVGYCSPTLYSQRARIAPNSTTTAFTPFFTISGSGCIFQNIQWFDGFGTGTTSQLNVVITGSRNVFQNCAIDGMGDTTSAASAGSRSLKISGGGENVFQDCTIGVDTITRSAANASLELAAGTARNVFRNCIFPFMTSSGSVLGILGTGAACVDRSNTFDQCIFDNALSSTSSLMTVLGSFTSAAPGGHIIFKGCMYISINKMGDANFLANSYIDMPAVSASGGGVGTNPS